MVSSHFLGSALVGISQQMGVPSQKEGILRDKPRIAFESCLNSMAIRGLREVRFFPSLSRIYCRVFVRLRLTIHMTCRSNVFFPFTFQCFSRWGVPLVLLSFMCAHLSFIVGVWRRLWNTEIRACSVSNSKCHTIVHLFNMSGNREATFPAQCHCQNFDLVNHRYCCSICVFDLVQTLSRK